MEQVLAECDTCAAGGTRCEACRLRASREYYDSLPERLWCVTHGQYMPKYMFRVSKATGVIQNECVQCRARVQQARRSEKRERQMERDETAAAAHLARRGEWAQMPHDDAGSLLVRVVETWEENGKRMFRAKIV